MSGAEFRGSSVNGSPSPSTANLPVTPQTCLQFALMFGKMPSGIVGLKFMSETELDRRSAQSAAVTEWSDGKVDRHNDYLVGEEPLLIQVGDQSLTVTMRTPGDDSDLAVGFLFTEGIIRSREEIISIRAAEGLDPGGSAVQVELKASATARSQAPKRNFIANSGCGMCGKNRANSTSSR